MKRRNIINTVTFLATLSAAVPIAAGQDSQNPTTGGQRQQKQERFTDDGIEQAVRARLRRLDAVGASNVQIEANKGTVTITGTVNSLMESDRVLEAVSGVRGVQNVISSFMVEPEKRPDNQIHQDVRDALAFDAVTSDADLKVEVNNGVVTLSGKAQIWSERQLATWLASDVGGVREVRNNITVAVAPRSDADIQQSIERRFTSDPLVSDNIQVKVDGSRVNLSGEVRSLLEKKWAIADARTLGVSGVDASGLRVNPNSQASTTRDAGSRTDEEIAAAIQNAFVYDPRVYSFNSKVEVKDRVVTLSGEVSTLKAKQAAVQLAQNTAGVKEVENNLSVRPPALPDAQIVQELRSAFHRSLLVDANQIVVKVEKGRATLTGRVDSNFETWAAEDIAARTRGITKIENNLGVDRTPVVASTEYYYPWHSSYMPWTYSSAEEPKTDAELLSDVRSQLLWSPFTDAEDITVSVKDGVVTLTGQVEDRREKGAAADNAYQAGAKRVENRLSVLAPTGR